MLDNRSIERLFCKDRVHFTGVEYALYHGGKFLYAEEDGLLFTFPSSHVLASYGADKETAKKMFSLLKSPEIIVCSSMEEAEAFKECFPYIDVIKPCYQVRYDKPASVPVPVDTVVKNLEVTEENIDLVARTYEGGIDRKYAIEYLERGMLASYTGGKLSGYIGAHSEGTIGVLVVMPEFRKMGIGSYLVNRSVEKFLSEGKIAYAHIVSTNEKSYNMHLKMGFVPSDKLVYWCYSSN